MLTLFYFVVIEQILQGLFSLFEGFRWLQNTRRQLSSPSGFYVPRVAVLCPVKGLEPGLEENLAALTQFDYVSYEIFFALASEKDPACEVVKRVAAKSKRPVHVVYAGEPHDCGEKVNNLRHAVEQAGAEFEVLVFADSDGRTTRRWLGRLVAPLVDPNLGAATAFRWLLPVRGDFWSAFVSAWNAPIATYLGDHNHNFCWGGGTAIRRDRFEEIRGLEAWYGSVSDDFSLTSAVQGAGFRIAFVPDCMVASPVDLDRPKVLEFTNRQMIITRVYAPRIWWQALIGHTLYCTAVILGIALWIENLVLGLPGLQLLLLALLPPILCALRGVLRLAAVQDLMPEWKQQLLRYGWVWTMLAPLVPFIALYNVVVSAFQRTITWRGTRYQLISSRQTQILAR